jgi:arabinose-5-phosphate isomerase
MKTITYHSQVAQILRMEAEAIAATAERLSSAKVERAIELLLACQGKVVLCGVGKSGIIAEKIAATMTSTGTPALCLRPTDALHGGLGIITSDDTVIILSNSGETEELVQMLPALTARRVPIIASLGNTRSTLARAAHVVLDASVDREVCPLGLAPTASTTVALALGDALAMTLMEAKGWTVEDFAFNHPAGRIGKRLTLRVRDLMHACEHTPTIDLSANWLTAITAIGRGGLGAVCVTDADDKLLGIITDGDVRRALEDAADGEATKLDSLGARDLMTPNPVTCSPDMLAYDALRLMEDRPSQINVLPVIEENERLVGMIRLHDIVRNGI